MTDKFDDDDLSLEELEALTNPDAPEITPVEPTDAGVTEGDEGEEAAGEESGLEDPLPALEEEVDEITEVIQPTVTEPTPEVEVTPEDEPTPEVEVTPEVDPLPPVEPPAPQPQYLDYDRMNFLGEVHERTQAGGDAPGIVVTGPVAHIRLKEKLNTLMDLVHPDTAFTITPERAVQASKTVTELLHMCFNAPMRDPINNDGANFQNSFQLLLEAMAHPLVRPAFDRRRIYSYNDPLLKQYPTLVSYMLRMTEKQTHNPQQWREEAKKLATPFALLGRQWPRNHLPKYEAFCSCWIAQ